MTFEFRIILIIASVLTVALILSRIRKSKVRIDDSIFWILLSAIILLISIFPGVADAVTGALHIYLTTNFLFMFFIFLLLVKLFSLSVEVSQLKSKVEKLTQENALANKESAARFAELEESVEDLKAAADPDDGRKAASGNAAGEEDACAKAAAAKDGADEGRAS